MYPLRKATYSRSTPQITSLLEVKAFIQSLFFKVANWPLFSLNILGTTVSLAQSLHNGFPVKLLLQCEKPLISR